MSSNGKNLVIGLRVKADLAQAKRSLEQLEQGLFGVDSSGKKASKGLNEAGESTSRLRKEVSQMPALLTRIAGLLGAAFSVREVAAAAEVYTQIRNRLSLVTKGSEELANAQDAVFTSAQSARQPLSATAELYQRIATNADALKLSGDGVASVVDVINKTLAISGTSGASSVAALTQLGQAFASGTLRGEELNSVLEQAPALAKTLADGLGVTVGQLRTLGEEGKLSAQNVIQALQSQADSVDQQFSKIQATGAQALTVLGNSLGRVIGELDTVTGSSAAFANMIGELSAWLDSGQLTDGLVESLSIWSSVFDSIGSDIDTLGGDLGGIESAADSTVAFLIDAFKKIPVNIRSAIQIATVEVLALIDKVVAYAAYGAAAVKAAFSSSTLDDASAELERRLNQINDIRRDSIGEILAERDAILETAKAERERSEQERKNREAARIEREKNIAALRNEAKNTPIELGGNGKGKNPNDKQEENDRKALAELNIQLLRAQGKEQEAAQAQLELKYGEMLKRLEAKGDDAGAKIIRELIDLQAAKASFDELEKSLGDTLNNISRAEDSINVQREAGLISEYEARQKNYELHQAQARKLEEIRPKLEALKDTPGQVGIAAQEVIAALDDEVLRLQSTMTLLQSTLREGLETGLTDAILGLANGTMKLRDAVRSLVQSVAESMAQMAAQALAQKAVASLFNMGGDKDGGESMKEGAMATSTAAAALTYSAYTWKATALQIEAAANRLAASGGGGSGGGSSSNWAATAFQMFASYYAADGGHITGPGTSTSDSIPAMLSNNEFVTRAAVVGQDGALDFLQDFNRRGMSALDDWARVRHSTGGLAGVPAPSMPAPNLGSGKLAEPASAFSATIPLTQNITVIDDPGRIAEAINTPLGEKNLMIVMKKNASTFRSILGTG